jgi:hypothetical protein
MSCQANHRPAGHFFHPAHNKPEIHAHLVIDTGQWWGKSTTGVTIVDWIGPA